MTDRTRATDPVRAPVLPDRITSMTNPRVKAAVRLRDRRERDATGLTILDGAREMLRALDAGIDIEVAFVTPELVRSADAIAVADRLRGAGAIIEVSSAVLEKVAFGDRSDGIVIVARVPTRTLGELALPDNALIVVLEGVEKPGNLGAVLRSADAAAATAVIAADALTDLHNPNVIRASVGTIFSVPVVAATSGRPSRGWPGTGSDRSPRSWTLPSPGRRSISAARWRSSLEARPTGCRARGGARVRPPCRSRWPASPTA
jgi:hypothetical protein